jgi:hypothetical protein
MITNFATKPLSEAHNMHCYFWMCHSCPTTQLAEEYQAGSNSRNWTAAVIQGQASHGVEGKQALSHTTYRMHQPGIPTPTQLPSALYNSFRRVSVSCMGSMLLLHRCAPRQACATRPSPPASATRPKRESECHAVTLALCAI